MPDEMQKELTPQPMGSGVQRELTPELKSEFAAISAADPNHLIKAEVVVQRAENPLSPLHKFFTWDNDKAAEEWRMMQARYLIRSFRIEIEPLQIIPAFVSLGENRIKGGGYSWTAEVLPQHDLKLNLLLTVMMDIENILRKVSEMPEVKPLQEAITNIRTHLSQ